MPYLPKPDRERMLREWEPTTPGELNFLITTLALRYWVNSKQNYQGLNDIVGAMTSAQAEFYRRMAVPYENAKARSNGDLYEDYIE